VSQRLEKSLRDSLSQLPKANLDIIVNADITKLKEHDYISRQDYIPRKGIMGRILLTVLSSAVIVVGICVWLLQGHSVYAMATLDANAGFVVTANRDGQVIKVKGVDGAALSILRDVNYSGADMGETMGALVLMSARQHYLPNNNPTILISVWDRDQENTRKLLSDISGQVDNAAKAANIEPVLLGQLLENGGALENNAERLGVTAGRLQLIDCLVKYKPTYTTEQLAKYNLENLLTIARDEGIDLPINGYRTVDVKPAGSGPDAAE